MAERKRTSRSALGASSNDEAGVEAARLLETGFAPEAPIFERGGRLFAAPRRVACRSCRWCGLGMAEHCERPHAATGALNELDGLIPLAEGVNAERAAFVGVLARAIRILRVVGPDDRALVTLLGMDAQTLLAAQLLGAASSKVRVLAVDGTEIERCDRWGIRHRAVADAGLRNDQDVVVLGRTVGLGPEVLPGLVRPRGRIIVTESAEPSAGMSPESIARDEFVLAGVRGGCLHEAAAMLASDRCPDVAGLGFDVVRGGTGGRPARYGAIFVSEAR